MPHLDLSTFSTQIFWALLCFFVLYLFLSSYAVPEISSVVKEREDLINGYIAKADEMKKKAEQALNEYNQALEKANAEAVAKTNQAMNELKEFIADKEKQLQKDLSEQIEKTQTLVQKSKEKAIKEADKASIELAQNIIKKIGINTISEEDIKKSV